MIYFTVIAIILFLLSCGILTAVQGWQFSTQIKHPAGKPAAFACTALLPFVLWATVMIYNGISICSCCGSININTYTEDHWITRVSVCRNCVKYVDCSIKPHPKTPLPQPLICLSCDGNINMRNDEFEELLTAAGLFIWLAVHSAVLVLLAAIELIEKFFPKRKTV